MLQAMGAAVLRVVDVVLLPAAAAARVIMRIEE
jgi:hypothetical protein